MRELSMVGVEIEQVDMTVRLSAHVPSKQETHSNDQTKPSQTSVFPPFTHLHSYSLLPSPPLHYPLSHTWVFAILLVSDRHCFVYLKQETRQAKPFENVCPVAWCNGALTTTLGLSRECYDPFDPNGNITITYDIQTWTTRGYVARVTVQNNYLFRHVEKPGWKLGWTWTRGEVIWSMSGAFATEQGNCSLHKFEVPHSCEESPVILDLTPEALPENRSDGCCRGGVLSASAVDPSNSFSSFEITVGGGSDGDGTEQPPAKVTLMDPGPGYTCSPFLDAHPTLYSAIDGKRQVQVFRTWKSTCTYSIFVDNKTPLCCVSLSTFYSPTITPCPTCSCGCRKADKTSVQCIRDEYTSSMTDSADNLTLVRCSDHMCPVRVHWHVKMNYVSHWRVKLTVSNYNYDRNYSNWNILVQHPGFNQPTEAFSFNSSQLPSFRFGGELDLFWGMESYNTELVESSESNVGHVSTEVVLEKDLESFTLRNGWALPRRVYFNGDDCQMPLPDTFPMLPNGSSKQSHPPPPSLAVLLFFVFSFWFEV